MKRNLWISILVTLVLLAAVAAISGPGLKAGAPVSGATDGAWGLSFQVPGQAPVANATAAYLQQYDSWYIGTVKGEEKNIYLTFDAGYENGYMEGILDVLKEKEVPAAFFLVGNYFAENPQLVNRMVEEGHLVGNHTMHHPDMSEIAEEEDFAKELKELEEVYQQVTGEIMKSYYRPPQGKFSQSNLKMAQALGYKTIFWSLAYVDWYEDQQPSREDALNLLNERIHPGAIVLLHSTSKTNSQILGELIDGWKEMGYTFCSLETLE